MWQAGHLCSYRSRARKLSVLTRLCRQSPQSHYVGRCAGLRARVSTLDRALRFRPTTACRVATVPRQHEGRDVWQRALERAWTPSKSLADRGRRGAGGSCHTDCSNGNRRILTGDVSAPVLQRLTKTLNRAGVILFLFSLRRLSVRRQPEQRVRAATAPETHRSRCISNSAIRSSRPNTRTGTVADDKPSHANPTAPPHARLGVHPQAGGTPTDLPAMDFKAGPKGSAPPPTRW